MLKLRMHGANLQSYVILHDVLINYALSNFSFSFQSYAAQW
jgi:hypothetical protein